MNAQDRKEILTKLVIETGVLTPHQQEIYNKIITDIDHIIENGGQWDNIVSLVGAAGVGKTFMTVHIIKAMLKLGYKIHMTTPTHKALKVARDMMEKEGVEVECSTIHSFLNLKLKPNYENGLQELIAEQFKKNTNRTDILIVDESSMVSSELYSHIEDAIRYRRAKCVFFIGDWFQLPPVDGEQNPVFTHNDKHEMTEIVRQAADNPIIKLATDIRQRIENGNFIPLDQLVLPYACKEIEIFNDGKQFMGSFFDGEWIKKDQVIASYTNATVDKYNRAVRKRYWKEQGVEDPEFLRIGDTVIFQEAHIEEDETIHNNNDIITIKECEKLFDDDIQCWYWKCFDEDYVPFYVIDPISKNNFDNYLKKVSDTANKAQKFNKKKLWELYYQVKNSFQPVKYAFASTTHKLQGSTFEHCYIDMREMRKYAEFQDISFIYRLLYVAVTRASKDIKILL